MFTCGRALSGTSVTLTQRDLELSELFSEGALESRPAFLAYRLGVKRRPWRAVDHQASRPEESLHRGSLAETAVPNWPIAQNHRSGGIQRVLHQRSIVQAESELVQSGQPVIAVEAMCATPPLPSIECGSSDVVFAGMHQTSPENAAQTPHFLVVSIMPAILNFGHPKSLLNFQ
jgi:hypothetical protein